MFRFQPLVFGNVSMDHIKVSKMLLENLMTEIIQFLETIQTKILENNAGFSSNYIGIIPAGRCHLWRMVFQWYVLVSTLFVKKHRWRPQPQPQPHLRQDTGGPDAKRRISSSSTKPISFKPSWLEVLIREGENLQKSCSKLVDMVEISSIVHGYTDFGRTSKIHTNTL